jgi:uncharacterized protein (TIGR04255 family)
MADPELSNMSYKRPPITEAIIGINFSSPIKQALISSVNKKFHTHYPQHQTTPNMSLGVHIDKANNVTTNINKEEEGHRRFTADMTELLVLWPISFTISQLAPYPGWDHFLERFVRDWGVWKRTVGFQTISRIGVRYINRIDLPVTGSVIEHEQFLNVYPKLPDSLDPVSGYALQAAFELSDIDCQLKINSASVPSPILGHVSFMIDLDISKEINPPQNDNDIYELLNKIRVKKNSVFESCIRSHARDLFNEVIN